MSFEIIKQNFERGLWTVAQVALAVKAGVITEEQFAVICKVEYTNG
jgi:hypothetical protein